MNFALSENNINLILNNEQNTNSGGSFRINSDAWESLSLLVIRYMAMYASFRGSVTTTIDVPPFSANSSLISTVSLL